ncbi:MAG TPA: aerotolerance regulator BatA [Elusimicrobia bacterium]|nr:aerotolerance regulator BatA [Elusimicrobiota bacterium]
MNFANPLALLLLPLLLAAMAFAGIRWEGKNIPAGSPKQLPSIPTFRTRLFSFFPFYSRAAVLILLTLALARPQKTERGQIPPAEGLDIMLTLDTSYSMAAVDLKPSRLDAAKSAASNFVKRRAHDRLGIVVFGGTAILTCPLTLDYSSVFETLDAAYLNMSKANGTAIGDAIATAVNHLKNSKAKSRIIILLTDGRSNTGLISDPVIAAKTAAAYGIKIYTVGTAGKGKAQVPTGNPFQPYVTIEEDLDEAPLMEIANTTGGEFYRATNDLELQRIYEKIDSLEKTKFEVKAYANYHDRYEPLLAAALILLGLTFVLEKTYLRTIP